MNAWLTHGLTLAFGLGFGAVAAGVSSPPSSVEHNDCGALAERVDRLEQQRPSLDPDPDRDRPRPSFTVPPDPRIDEILALLKAAPPRDPAVVERSPDVQAQVDELEARGTALIDRAVQVGRWTLESRDELRAVLQSLPDPENFEIERRLTIEINEQRLRLDYRGSPL